MPICQTHPQISGAHSSTTTKLQYSELAFFKATVLALSLSTLSWDSSSSSSSTTSFSFSSSESPAANSENSAKLLQFILELYRVHGNLATEFSTKNLQFL
jgi:hypothetical protein